MKYVSLCDGIGASHCAAYPLGWRCLWTSEIEPFPIAVVEHHWKLPNLGDMTKITKEMTDEYGQPDVVVGGTPCQSFSVAGLRGGMADPRGNLALVFLGLVDRLRPRWMVWENVPGVLSSNGGKDFGAFLGGLAECGYGFAYRVLDAQYFNLAQRRERVFVVGHSDWRRAASVLFERASLRGHSPPRREAGERVAASVAPSLRASGVGTERIGDTRGQDCCVIAPACSPALKARDSKGPSSDGDGDGAPLVVHAIHTAQTSANGHGVSDNVSYTLDGANGQAVTAKFGVRRLMPIECERLQGFPDSYSAITCCGKPAKDAPRYRALGNSMAVPVMRWIFERIAEVDSHA